MKYIPLHKINLNKIIRLDVTITVKRKDGRIERYYYPNRRLLRNGAIKIMCWLLKATSEYTNLQVVDINGNPRNIYDTWGHYYAYIHYGSGTKPWAYDDYKLDNQVGVIDYSDVSRTKIKDDSEGYGFRLSGSFTAGSSFTLAEVGLARNILLYDTDYRVLFDRCVLDTPIPINAGDTVGISYDIYYLYQGNGINRNGAIVIVSLWGETDTYDALTSIEGETEKVRFFAGYGWDALGHWLIIALYSDFAWAYNLYQPSNYDEFESLSVTVLEDSSERLKCRIYKSLTAPSSRTYYGLGVCAGHTPLEVTYHHLLILQKFASPKSVSAGDTIVPYVEVEYAY
ncbi:MAG: hypothetical protein DRN49_05745 [Thaumarchaeota archaeon]|nr:MAG: hypothetical protein DRN49_05745 [Nitrososphaerota archaeon]